MGGGLNCCVWSDPAQVVFLLYMHSIQQQSIDEKHKALFNTVKLQVPACPQITGFNGMLGVVVFPTGGKPLVAYHSNTRCTKNIMLNPNGSL